MSASITCTQTFPMVSSAFRALCVPLAACQRLVCDTDSVCVPCGLFAEVHQQQDALLQWCCGPWSGLSTGVTVTGDGPRQAAVRSECLLHYCFCVVSAGAFPLSQLLALTVRHKAGWDGEFWALHLRSSVALTFELAEYVLGSGCSCPPSNSVWFGGFVCYTGCQAQPQQWYLTCDARKLNCFTVGVHMQSLWVRPTA